MLSSSLRLSIRAWWLCLLPLFSWLVTAGFFTTEQTAHAAEQPAQATNGNRLTYLDEFCDPYYPSLEMPKLVTPQWIGEQGVEAVITLGIDDMRAPEPYEKYLRPILERLKEIDGRAPVSILTNQIDPKHPQLPKWLAEGLSLETHTADHPCPCLQGGDFAKAKSTYERCVDQLAEIEGSHPVAFRFPCMDSLNTPSPRAYVELINRKTAAGNFLQLSTSTLNIFNADDPTLDRKLVLDDAGKPRFEQYVPFRPFVNKVYNYPYPYVISGTLWEFPCGVPDDWQGQKRQAPRNPKTVVDLKAMIDASVAKQGVANVVFHPYDWLRNDQFVDVIDHVVEKHGRRAKFLNFNECLSRLNEHLLAGQPLRAANGEDNGVRLLDVNNDGYLDVVIGNENLRKTRLWQPKKNSWREIDFPAAVVDVQPDGTRLDAGVRFGVLQASGFASFVVANEQQRGLWHFDGKQWKRDAAFGAGPLLDSGPFATVKGGKDQGVRLRDIDGNGICELLIANPKTRATFLFDKSSNSWRSSKAVLPEPLVNSAGGDAGTRLVDLNGDGHDDVIFSNEHRYSVHVYVPKHGGWSRRMRAGHRRDKNAIPMIVRAGTNNGAWFTQGHMWIQNEDTNRLPAGIDQRSFAELLGKDFPPPKSAEESHQTIRVREGLKVELVAAEPLVRDPIAIDWGADGKLWVVEMADYPLGMDNQGKPGGRVRFLEDTTGDGKYDKSTLFLDGLPYPTGVMAYHGGVLVSAAPQVIYAEDTTGDGLADVRQVLYEGFGLGNQQHRMNGFSQGLDGWIYLANGGSPGTVVSNKTGQKVATHMRDLRIRPFTGEIETLAGHSQFGRRRDDWGNWFGCDNVTPLRHFLLTDRYLRRNPHAAPAGTELNLVRTDNTQLFPISRVLSHFQGYRPPAPGERHRFTSASATDFYRDNLLGEDFYGNTFTSAPVHNLVHRRVMAERGLTFSSRRADDEQDREFLASSDSWFRPTMARTGPDGALYVVDMYRLVIEHPEWIDDAYEKELDLRAGHQQGRIYRVVPADKPLREVPRFDKLKPAELVALLKSPNGIQRDMAQRLLVRRRDASVVEPLRELIKKDSHPLARIHALYTLQGLGRLEEGDASRALMDEHPQVVRHALRISETAPSVGGLVPDEDELELDGLELDFEPIKFYPQASPQVRLQLAYSLGGSQSDEAGRYLGHSIMEHCDDAMYVAAVVSSLHAKNLANAMPQVVRRRDESEAARRVFEQLVELAAAQKNQIALQQVVAAIAPAESKAMPTTKQYDAVRRLLTAFRRRGASYREVLAPADQAVVARVIAAALAAAKTPPAQSNSSEAAASATPSSTTETAAIELLGFVPAAESDGLLKTLGEVLAADDQPTRQDAAIRALGNRPGQDVADVLLAKFLTLTPRQQSLTIDVLLTRVAWTEQLLAALIADDVSLGTLSLEQRDKLLSHRSKAVREQAAELFKQQLDTDRRALVARYLSELPDDADIAAGRQLFAKHCATCHRAGDVGHAVGPDLAALKDRSPPAIATAVLDPNQAIEFKFRSYNVLTADGRMLSGLLAAETGSSITLLAAGGEKQVLLRTEIDEIRAAGKSLMPEGLETQISAADLANLTAYLSTLGR